MRFKASIVDMKLFMSLVTSLQSITGQVVYKLQRDKVGLICTSGQDGVKAWAEIATSSIFDSESLILDSNTNNTIHLRLQLDSLSRALKSSQSSLSVTVKLGKSTRGAFEQGGDAERRTAAGPVLVFNISGTGTNNDQNVTQEVGVAVLRTKEVESLVAEPLCPLPEVSIRLPPLKALQTVTDRLGRMSTTMSILANREGEFRLQIMTDKAKVQSEWRGLNNPRQEEEESDEEDEEEDEDEDDEEKDEANNETNQFTQDDSQFRARPKKKKPKPKKEKKTRDPSKFAAVRVKSKSAQRFFANYGFAKVHICCLCEDFCCIFYVYLGDHKDGGVKGGVLIFFVPALDLEGDQENEGESE